MRDKGGLCQEGGNEGGKRFSSGTEMQAVPGRRPDMALGLIVQAVRRKELLSEMEKKLRF